MILTQDKDSSFFFPFFFFFYAFRRSVRGPRGDARQSAIYDRLDNEGASPSPGDTDLFSIQASFRFVAATFARYRGDAAGGLAALLLNIRVTKY